MGEASKQARYRHHIGYLRILSLQSHTVGAEQDTWILLLLVAFVSPSSTWSSEARVARDETLTSITFPHSNVPPKPHNAVSQLVTMLYNCYTE
jgi:hypothetical protein